MKIWLVKNNGGLFPANNSDYEQLKKLKIGQEYLAEVKRPRNAKFHRKFFALMNLVYSNQEVFETLDEVRYYITMKCGYYRRVKTPSGEMLLPKSIAFAKMSQSEFDDLYEKTLLKIEELFHFDKDLINENLPEFY